MQPVFHNNLQMHQAKGAILLVTRSHSHSLLGVSWSFIRRRLGEAGVILLYHRQFRELRFR
jgi:hypothetical protein